MEPHDNLIKHYQHGKYHRVQQTTEHERADVFQDDPLFLDFEENVNVERDLTFMETK